VRELLDGVTDPDLATLATVLDPVGLAPSLLPVLPRHWGDLQEARVHVLRHDPGKRCTVAIAVRTTRGWHDLIGRVYATDRSDVYRALERIRDAGFGPDAAFSIPQPLVYVPALHWLLLENVPGPLASEMVLAGPGRDRAVAAQHCARWLARFQEVAPRSGPLFNLYAQLRATDRWAQGLAALEGPLADKARRLHAHVDAAAGALNGSNLCAGHGRYSPSHVVLAPGRTVAIDWDGYDVADPARDVAHFLVALKRLALGRLGSIRALDALADVFVQTYLGLGQEDAAARLPCYQAAIWLQSAATMAHRGQPHWQVMVQTMLDEGLRTLEHHV
jgi:aminoglycoside phosphotransferase (APT) family kinase protein